MSCVTGCCSGCCCWESVVDFCREPQIEERINAIPEIVKHSLSLVGDLCLIVPCGGWRWAVSKNGLECPFSFRWRIIQQDAVGILRGLVGVFAPEKAKRIRIRDSFTDQMLLTLVERGLAEDIRMIDLRVRVIARVAYRSLHFVGSVFMSGVEMGKWVVQHSSREDATRRSGIYLKNAGLDLMSVLTGVGLGVFVPVYVEKTMMAHISRDITDNLQGLNASYDEIRL